jgi:hypothetical protein
MANSCALLFILPQPSPATVRESNNSGSVEHVFQWITANGPAPNINPRFARIEIIESIAVVHLEVQRWSGKLAGANARASDVFTLLKCNGEWKITHKLFPWHDQ